MFNKFEMTKQKTFKFKFSDLKNKEDIYVNLTNKDAYLGVIKSKIRNIFLTGPKQSGKSLLGNIWLKKNNAIQYNNNLSKIVNSNQNVFVDDLDSFSDQEDVFHIINHCNLNQLNILICSKLNVKENKFTLSDLNSRLKIFSQFCINQPDDDMLLNILTKLFVEKQFVINSHEIFNYIIKRADRSYEEMSKIVDKLDLLSLEKKRQLTIPLVKEIL